MSYNTKGENMTPETMAFMLSYLAESAPDPRIKIISSTLCGLLRCNDEKSNANMMAAVWFMVQIAASEKKRLEREIAARAVLCGEVGP